MKIIMFVWLIKRLLGSVLFMKIITCAPLPPPGGGIANWYNIICSEAEQNGCSFCNVNTSPRKSIEGRTIFYRVFIQGFRMIKQCFQLKSIINKNRDAHVAHIATSGQLALIRDIVFLYLFKKNNIKTAYHIHYGRVPDIVKNDGIEKFLFCRACSMASEVIVIDPKSFDTLSTDLGYKNISYIPNPVKKVKTRKNQYTNNVVYLGNVLYSKGIEELLQAWEQLACVYPDWNLTIAGFCEYDYRNYLEKEYSMNNVKMTGWLSHDKALALLSESAFLVLPSHTEGFPNVVLEAMMCGKAVIATDVGAISDILDDDCGIVIQPQSISEIKSSIENLILNKEKSVALGNNGKEKVLQKYSSDIVFGCYTDVWHRLSN